MDDHSIAWMISGGARTESRDPRLQRVHRAALGARKPRRDDLPWTNLARSWRERLAARFGRFDSGPVTRTPDCCPA